MRGSRLRAGKPGGVQHQHGAPADRSGRIPHIGAVIGGVYADEGDGGGCVHASECGDFRLPTTAVDQRGTTEKASSRPRADAESIISGIDQSVAVEAVNGRSVALGV